MKDHLSTIVNALVKARTSEQTVGKFDIRHDIHPTTRKKIPDVATLAQHESQHKRKQSWLPMHRARRTMRRITRMRRMRRTSLRPRLRKSSMMAQ